MIAFSFPSVQTKAAQWTTSYLNDSYDTDISIEKIHVSYSGNVSLENALALDHRQDTVIFINQLETSIVSFGDLFNGQPDLGSVDLDGLYLNIHRYKEDARDNLSLFIDKFGSSNSSNSAPFILEASELNITNSHIIVYDETIKYPESFNARNLNMVASDFKIDGGVITANIENSNFLMHTGVMKEENGVTDLIVKNLKSDFTYTSSQIHIDDLYIETAGSKLEGDLKLNYQDNNFSDFTNKVDWDFQIDESVIATNELRLFYNELVKNETVSLSGHMTGNLNDFKVNQMKASTLNDISIDGDMHFVNVVDNLDDFFIEGTFNQLMVSNKDLKTFLPNILGKSLPVEIDELGSINAQGYASVDANTVVSRLSGTSRKGAFDTDLVLTNIQSAQPGYKGKIKVTDLDIGALLSIPSLGKTTLNLIVDGKGFNPDQLNTNINGGVINLEYNGYVYRNIKVNGTLKKPLFDGRLSINDPNIKMTFDGLADLSQEINKYDFKASIAYADLNAINIFKRDSTAILKGDIVMAMQGTTINDAFGFVEFKDASYKNDNKEYVFEDFKVVSSFDEDVRKITINSPDIIEGELSGKFKLEEIPELFKNAIGNVYTNYRSETVTKDQYLDYEFQIYDKIVDLVFPDIALGENTTLKGQVASNEAQFKMTFRTPEIKLFDDIKLDKVNVQINNQNPLFNTYIKINNVKNGVYDVNDFKLINVTNKDTLFFRTEFASEQRESDKYNLSFYHTVNDSSQSVVGIRKSDIKFQGKKWFLNNDDKKVQLTFDHEFKNFSLDTLVFKHSQEYITLAGDISGKEQKDLHLDFKDVRISSLTSPIDSLKMKGLINGSLELNQKDGKYAPTSDFTVSDFEVNDTPLGDFELVIAGNDDLTQYKVNAQLKDDIQRTLWANGTVNTSGVQSKINVDVNFNEFNLVALSPLGGEVLDNMRGFATGEIGLTGLLVEPNLSGGLVIKDGGLNIPYLNTDFDLAQNSEITVSTDLFDFNTIELTDTKYGTKGTLSGVIKHKNFGFWELGLNLSSDRLLVLDTGLTPESLYYGTAFIDGTASITGPTDKLFIDVNATTGEDTIFKVPLNDAESIGDNSVIYFLSPEEKEARVSGEDIEIEDISGLELRFNLKVTPEAEVEITVDQENGSYLRGSGAGNLLLEINTLGKFNMYGDFIVYDGIYNFKYAGIVNKEFTIQPGGTVDWNGSPTEANIDVSATYKTQANPAILLDNPNINSQIPVEVITKLEGNLSYFDPEFEIKFPNANSVVSSELQYRLEDKAQRYLQAMSLITGGTFYNPNSIGQNAVTGNLVESLSGIVNDLVGNRDGDIQFGVNYEASERNPNSDLQRSDRFGVTVTTQITDRVLINGKLGVPVGSTSATERAVIGNVEIEFLLNEDGSLRLKIFNREDNLQQIGDISGYAQGIGLSWSVDFDTLKELYQKIFNKKMEIEKQSPKQPTSTSLNKGPVDFKD
ncbi:translocation/assembly module TamB domain-containing protein [Nonlabens mediterrranea]|uniref:Translocation/assembly module TamB domain-containing protein n=1 Tax=Nonlabens mediterrranea TaxID=1419947 RepID=A0ABS0A5K0_9FLAO|nr:translocation/assembly module TamB domain-containing protein [Nonlabens mediterrranea]